MLAQAVQIAQRGAAVGASDRQRVKPGLVLVAFGGMGIEPCGQPLADHHGNRPLRSTEQRIKRVRAGAEEGGCGRHVETGLDQD